MKRTYLLLIGMIALIVWTNLSFAEVIPVFAPAEFATWGSGQTIMTDNNGVIPCVGDWNGDGIKDLMVGTYYYGNIYYFQNAGTNENPDFPTRAMLQADGSNISVTYG